MKDVMATLALNYIDLSDLSDFLRSNRSMSYNFDSTHWQIFEEVSFLCANRDFIKDVVLIRNRILRKYPKLNVPTTDTRQAEYVLGFVYEYTYKSYRRSVIELMEKYKLLSHLYWKDKFLMLDIDMDNEIERAIDHGDRITRKEARARAIKRIKDDIDLELLDSIIIRNKPYDRNDGFPFWANPYFTRKNSELRGLTIKINKDSTLPLEIGFPPYATLPEMQRLLKKYYSEIQRCREVHLPILVRRDHRKDNLPKMIDAYLLDTQGKSKAIIANVLDKKYGGSITFEAVTLLVERMKRETDRFRSGKQKT